MSKDYEIKFKLGADLETSFSKSFAGASKDFKAMQQHLTSLNRGMVGNFNMTKPLRTDIEKTRQAFGTLHSAGQKMINSLKVAGGTLVGGFAINKVIGYGKDVVQTYANFEQGMANVKAVSGVAGDEFAKLSAKAREMGERTSKTASEAADGLQFLALAGWNTEQMLAGIEPVLRLSEAGAMDLGRASDLATDSMAALGLGVKDLPAYLDKVAQTSRRSNTSVQQLMEAFLIAGGSFKTFNVPLEEATSLLGSLANRGFKGSEAGTAMNAIITNLTSGLGQSGTAMKKLKLSAFDAKGNFKGLEKVFSEVKAKIDPMTDSQKAMYISMLAGKEHLKTFTGILDGLGNEYGNLKKEVSNADGALMEMANTQMDTFLGSMKLVESAVESAKISIGERMAPTIRRFADNLANWIPKAMSQLDTLMAGPNWQKADFFGKIKLSWDKIIGQPLSGWWDSSGRSLVSNMGKEAGKLLWSGIKGIGKEALSFNGGSSILAASALSIPAAKIGKTTKGLLSVGKAGTTAASSMGIVAKSAGLAGPAIGLLANPIGLTIAAVGALAGGWYLYRRHQENARQSLIHMGDDIKKVWGEYTAVETKTKTTKELTAEYKRLSDKIADSATPVEQLREAKRKLGLVEQQLIDMHPDIISQYDLENGKLKEKVGLLDKISETELESAKIKLEKEISDKSGDKDELEKQISKLTEKKETSAANKDKYAAASQGFQALENQLQRLQMSDLDSFSEEYQKKIADIRDRANEIGQTVGRDFSNNIGHLIGASDDMKKLQKEALDDLVQADTELIAAKASYQELYDLQKNFIELNLGSTLEDQAAKYNQLSEEGKKTFRDALISITDLNNQMGKPLDKVVNVSVMWQQIGAMPTPANNANRLNAISGGAKLDGYADGGIASKPSIFGEAGPEIAIPINNKPRSQSLLDTANRLIGRPSSSKGGSGDINVSFAPQITVQGGSSDVSGQLSQALQKAEDNFERRFKAMIQQERRLSFNG